VAIRAAAAARTPPTTIRPCHGIIKGTIIVCSWNKAIAVKLLLLLIII
jgi:hypothetical protein